jgi:hypothetical protein
LDGAVTALTVMAMREEVVDLLSRFILGIAVAKTGGACFAV